VQPCDACQAKGRECIPRISKRNRSPVWARTCIECKESKKRCSHAQGDGAEIVNKV
jgi:hypothetical protein